MAANRVYSLENAENPVPTAFEIGVCLDLKLSVLFVGELIFELLSMLNAVYLIKILTKVGIIHLNLKINCCNMCVCIIFRAILRFCLIFHYLNCSNIFSWNGRTWLVFALGLFNVGSHFIEVVIAVERIISMFAAKNYEKWFSFKFAMILCSTPYWLALGANFIVLYFQLVAVMTANYILLALLVLIFLVLFASARIKDYLNDATFRNKSLTERYQESENWKTFKTMKYLGVFCSIHIFVASVVQISKGMVLVNRSKAEVAYLTVLFECLLHVVYSFSFFLFPFIFVFTIRQIGKRYRLLFPMKSGDNAKELADVKIHPENLPYTSQLHFHTLANYWNHEFQRKQPSKF